MLASLEDIVRYAKGRAVIDRVDVSGRVYRQ